MTNRVSYTPQDFQKMCKQAERDHESKKLVFLMDRVKRQIAERSNPNFNRDGGTLTSGIHGERSVTRLPARSVPLER